MCTFRLLPKNSQTAEGKRHVHTVPVRLICAQNSAHRHHPDHYFAMATIDYLKDLSVVMGHHCVFFLSQDDKARVPLGLPAANKQVPILMHLEYKVQLPDHDWVIGEGHKLIPSVYAACVIKDSAVSYSGPTFIAIRYAVNLLTIFLAVIQSFFADQLIMIAALLSHMPLTSSYYLQCLNLLKSCAAPLVPSNQFLLLLLMGALMKIHDIPRLWLLQFITSRRTI